jgi:drug/metabolite transporter (DMT)-like permease
MLGVIIVFFSTLFDEIANSITKAKLSQKKISVYSIGMINCLAVVIFFIIINIVKREFIFSPASLPTLSLRALLEIILTCAALKATEITDRSTFGFIRVVTIPLLLMVDFLLGYRINVWQFIGISIIIFSLFIVFSYQGIKKQGAWLSLLTAIMAVATITLYKYDITHYNSVASEQTIIYLILMTFLAGMAFFKAKENPFTFLKQKIYIFQTLINAVPSLVNSYAYALAPASIIVSAYRSSAVFWTVVSGKVYFKEKHLLVKLVCLSLLVGGIVLLVF